MAYNYPYNYPQYPQYSYAQNNVKTMEWVDGEVGAKAYQMPAGWPVNSPIALWDSTEKKIFLKSWNQMGMPNPMQEIEYTIKEKPNPMITSGDTQYVTKKDFDQLKHEIKALTETVKNQNNRNRGGQE